MADPFDCPKCGAPLLYNAEEQNYAETISCPYCNNSVIVPPQMRIRPVQPVQPRVQVSDYRNLSNQQIRPVYTQPVNPPVVREVGRGGSGRIIGGCVFAALLLVAIFIAVNVLLFSQTKTALLQAFNQAIPSLAVISSQAPTATDVTASIQTQISPLIAQATEIVGQVSKQLTATPLPSNTPTPKIDHTATASAELESTRTAQLAIASEHWNWPIVLQEKFNNANRNWNVGSSNSKLSVEDLKITGNQYIWQLTSKKSMGSFSFPDMKTLTDMYVSVDVKMTNSTGNTSDQAGIIFRQADNAFYFFGANPQGTYSLRMYDGSGWNDLIPLSESALLKPGVVNHLGVSIQGTQIILVINDQVADGFDDSQLRDGAAGLGVNLPAPGEDATVIFTNFIVHAP